MSKVTNTTVESQPFVYYDPNKKNDKVSQLPRIALQGLTPTDKEQVIKNWTEKCKSERIQAAKSIACGTAALLITGAALSFMLHFFVLHTITSFFHYVTWGVYRSFIAPTTLSILGFGGGLGLIGAAGFGIFNKFIGPHFDKASNHLKKARLIERELLVAHNPKAGTAQPTAQRKAIQTVATKVLSKKELDRNRWMNYAKAIGFTAAAIAICASSAVVFYVASKALLYLLIEMNFIQVPYYYTARFVLNSDVAASIVSVVLGAEFTTLAGMGLYGVKKAVSKLVEKAQENWNKASDNYYHGILSLSMQKEEAADFEKAIENSRLEANIRNDKDLLDAISAPGEEAVG